MFYLTKKNKTFSFMSNDKIDISNRPKKKQKIDLSNFKYFKEEIVS